MNSCDPHHNEYLAAIAALPDQTISRDTTLRVGRQVRVPRAFGNGYQYGTIAQSDRDRHLGVVWLVDTPEGRLKLLPDEIEIVQPTNGAESDLW